MTAEVGRGPAVEAGELLTVPQAAARVGLKRAALDRFIADGRLPVAVRAGRLRLLRAADVDAWAATPRRGGGRPRKPQSETEAEARTPDAA